MPKECDEIMEGGKKCRTRIGPYQVKCKEHNIPVDAAKMEKVTEIVGTMQKAIEDDFKRTHEAIMHPERATHATGLQEKTKSILDIIPRIPSTSPIAEWTMPEPKTKPPRTAKCFFCAEDHEHLNDVGDITLKDPDGNERSTYVCHYCTSACLEDLLQFHAEKEGESARYAQIMGALMFRRALDSRA